MNPKLKGVILAFIIVIIAGAGALIFHQISIRKENAAEAEYLKKNLPSYSSITIISDFKEKDNNTLTAFKEAVRTGADIVTLDLCFNDAGDPMICSDYSKITDNTLPLSELFRVINTDEYKNIRLNLRLRQLGSLETFNKLISENAMSGRVILSGIDKERYGIIQGDKIAADLFYRYKPQKDIDKTIEEIRQLFAEDGIDGVIIDYKDISAELADSLNNSGMSFIVSGVNKKSDMFKAVDMGISLIQTQDTAQLKDIYTKWKEATVNNIDEEINKSLQQQNG